MYNANALPVTTGKVYATFEPLMDAIKQANTVEDLAALVVSGSIEPNQFALVRERFGDQMVPCILV